MQSTADNSTGVVRLNHFISVYRDNRLEMRKTELGEREMRRERVRVCFVSEQKRHFQGSNYDAEKM